MTFVGTSSISLRITASMPLVLSNMGKETSEVLRNCGGYIGSMQTHIKCLESVALGCRASTSSVAQLKDFSRHEHRAACSSCQ